MFSCFFNFFLDKYVEMLYHSSKGPNNACQLFKKKQKLTEQMGTSLKKIIADHCICFNMLYNCEQWNAQVWIGSQRLLDFFFFFIVCLWFLSARTKRKDIRLPFVFILVTKEKTNKHHSISLWRWMLGLESFLLSAMTAGWKSYKFNSVFSTNICIILCILMTFIFVSLWVTKADHTWLFFFLIQSADLMKKKKINGFPGTYSLTMAATAVRIY